MKSKYKKDNSFIFRITSYAISNNCQRNMAKKKIV